MQRFHAKTMTFNQLQKMREMPTIKNWAQSYLVFAALIFVVGCGSSTPTITGTVTYNGEPVENGYISFRPAEGNGQSFATRIANGQFSAVDKVTTGMKRVLVTGFDESSPITREESSRRFEAGTDKPTDYIAEDAEGNSKQVDILPGDQTMDFSITGDPRK